MQAAAALAAACLALMVTGDLAFRLWPRPIENNPVASDPAPAETDVTVTEVTTAPAVEITASRQSDPVSDRSPASALPPPMTVVLPPPPLPAGQASVSQTASTRTEPLGSPTEAASNRSPETVSDIADADPHVERRVVVEPLRPTPPAAKAVSVHRRAPPITRTVDVTARKPAIVPDPSLSSLAEVRDRAPDAVSPPEEETGNDVPQSDLGSTIETASLDAEALREGRVMLRLLEHGNGPRITLDWPPSERERSGLQNRLRRCHGMQTGLLDDTQGSLHLLAGPVDMDRISGFVRAPDGYVGREERADADQLRKRHGPGRLVRVFPRSVDAGLIAGLSRLIGSDYRRTERIVATYRLISDGVSITGVTVDGRRIPGQIALGGTGRC